jgi:hypothetical protein
MSPTGVGPENVCASEVLGRKCGLTPSQICQLTLCHNITLTLCPFESYPVEGEWPLVFRYLLLSKMQPNFKTCTSLGNNKHMVMGPDGTRNQDWPCWWGPVAIYPTKWPTCILPKWPHQHYEYYTCIFLIHHTLKKVVTDIKLAIKKGTGWRKRKDVLWFHERQTNNSN